MGIEIERKFLLKDDSWKAFVAESFDITQAYLSRDPARTVRIRRRGDSAFLTIKGMPENTTGTPVVPEFEYAIPTADADALLALCLPGAIIKTRHIVVHADNRWEIDVFGGDNAGLVVAEIELSATDEEIDLPGWLGAEVTQDRRFSNATLAQTPYKTWGKPQAPYRIK